LDEREQGIDESFRVFRTRELRKSESL
jgi:hypothetical protein